MYPFLLQLHLLTPHSTSVWKVFQTLIEIFASVATAAPAPARSQPQNVKRAGEGIDAETLQRAPS